MELEQGKQRGSIAAEVRRYRDGDAGAAEVLARRATTLALRTAATQPAASQGAAASPLTTLLACRLPCLLPPDRKSVV